MAYARRKRYRRSYRRRFSRRRFRRRYTRRYRRRTRGTKSAIIKLSLDGTWQFRLGADTTSGTPTYSPFTFSPTSVPGFTDYFTTYTKFRILKAYLYVGRSVTGDVVSNALTGNYLIVGSRPFATIRAPIAASNGQTPGPSYMVRNQTEESLRQTKWQKVKYPSTTRTAMRVGFYPYTLVTTGGPAVGANLSNNGYNYQRIWEAKRWMPITWAGGSEGTTPSVNASITFYGPYMVADQQTVSGGGEFPANASLTSNVQLVIRVQFSGQR